MTTRMRSTGEFCWFNLMTPQPAEARGFFGELFGWTYSEIPNVGHTVHLGGHKIGGFFENLAPDGRKIDAHIGIMIKVDNADSAVIRAAAHGGSARPPFDVMGNLRMAVCTDPSGAMLDFWESKTEHGTDVDAALHGAPCWIELLTDDVDRATKFYGGLFGWTTEKMHPPGMEYTVFKRGTDGVGGAFQITPEMAA
jgi:predicted enzyme related to lactoylglutathione lyase